MWENETIVLITSLKKRLLSGNSRVRFSKIFADSALPVYIKDMYQNQVEKFIQTENPISVQKTLHFDLTDKDLTHIKERFQDVFREVATFSADEVEEILRIALIQRMDYLVKPVDTMRRVLFEDQKKIDIEQMTVSLNPFLKLSQYAEKLLDECRRLGHMTIETDEYSQLINEILFRISENEPLALVLKDFSILTDYLSETKGEEVSRIEGPVLQEFMADRNLWGFRRALDVEMKLGKDEFNAVDLEMTLKRYIELKSEFSKEEKETRIQSPDYVFQAEKAEKPLAEEDIRFDDLDLTEANNENMNLNDIEIMPPEEKMIEEVKIKPPEPKVNKDNEGWDLDDVLGSETLIQEEKPAEIKDDSARNSQPVKAEEKTQPKKQMRIIRRDQNPPAAANINLKDQFGEVEFSASAGLRQMIDSKTEKVFIKKLFSNDQESYNQLMTKLEESESWRVAKILIDNELFKRDVDPFSREAIKLVDLVYSRYYPEEGVGGK